MATVLAAVVSVGAAAVPLGEKEGTGSATRGDVVGEGHKEPPAALPLTASSPNPQAGPSRHIAWGMPVHGLQLGIRLFRSRYGFDNAFVAYEVILRNVSDNTLSVISLGQETTARILTREREPVPEAPEEPASRLKVYRMGPRRLGYCVRP